jgi:hypothetical protein
MTFRRRQRWLRRLALGFAFATALFAGKVSPAWAVADEGGSSTRIVTAGGWTGAVDAESGIPVSAGIPNGDEQYLNTESMQVIPYLSHGILTEADAAQAAAEAIHDPYLTDVFVRQGESLGGPDGDETAFANAIRSQPAPSGDEVAFSNAIASQDPFLTDVNVRQGESLGGPDGGTLSHQILGEFLETRQAPEPFIPGVTDFPKPTVTATPTRPDDRADRFTGLEQPPVISYLSHGMGADGEVGARPDNRADRFAHSDVPAQPELSSGGWNVEWNEAVSVGIGALVLVLALGLAFGYLRRPRLAL